jgi:regulator of replication initiation timing
MERIRKSIERWFELKNQIAELESQLEDAKNEVIDIMNTNNVNILVSDEHIVKRTKILNERINKKDVPEDIWKTYVKKSEYWTYKITEK